MDNAGVFLPGIATGKKKKSFYEEARKQGNQENQNKNYYKEGIKAGILLSSNDDTGVFLPGIVTQSRIYNRDLR